MDFLKKAQDLLDFIQSCPTMYHTADTIHKRLDQEGYHYLKEGEKWDIKQGGKYYTMRNHSTVIAFQVGTDLKDYHFQMSASHGDNPSFKVKAVAELEGPADYLRLNVEAYGGPMDATWTDRPLSLAGRVLVKCSDHKVESRLIAIDRDLLLIPNVAIHLTRDKDAITGLNRAIDLCPLLFAGEMKKSDFLKMIAQEVHCTEEAILGYDLLLVNRQRPTIWGYQKEFLSSPKLDDLQGTFANFEGFLSGRNSHTINVFACFDNEEVGSNTKQGAMSTALKDTLKRLNRALGKTEEDYHRALAKSFLVSIDNGHAMHPNHPELTDKGNYAQLNRGLEIKEMANQKYTTDGFSRAVFEMVCQKAQVPVQHFANRSDKLGGSTLGNLSNTQVSVHAVDIGIPQLAMHSAYETAGVKDTAYTIEALKTYFSTTIVMDEAEGFTFE